MVYTAFEAAELLKKEGIEASVLNARFAKPLDEEAILALAKEAKLIFTLEEGALIGGFGSAVLELLQKESAALPSSVKIKILGIPDRFIEHGKRERLLDSLGLSATKVVQLVSETLSGKKGGTDQRKSDTASFISIR